MDPSLFDSLASTAGVVGALSIIALTFVWREWRKDAAAKDALYESYVTRLVEIIGDYHDFAHVLDRLADEAGAPNSHPPPPAG